MVTIPHLELVHHASSLAHNCCSAQKVKVLSEEEKDCWPLQRGTIFPLPLTADVCLILWYVLLLQKRNLKCWGLLFCLSLSLSDSFSLSGCASLQGWEGKCWPALFLCLLLGHGAPPSPHSYLFLRHLPILCHQGEGNLSPAWYIQFITVPQTRFKIKVWSTKLKQVEIKIGIGQRRREQSTHVVLFHLFWFMLSRRAAEKLKHYPVLSAVAYVVVIKAKTAESGAG